MLVAKLDLAQYIAVRSGVQFLGSKFQGFLRKIKQQPYGGHAGEETSSTGRGGESSGDVVDVKGAKMKVEPVNGRMPNASGRFPRPRMCTF